MPIIIPLTTVSDYPATAGFQSDSTLSALLGYKHRLAAGFSSASTLTAALSQTLNVGGSFVSASSLSALLGLTTDIAAAFVSDSSLAANLRLNDEPNVFPEAGFNSVSTFTPSVSRVFRALIAGFESESTFTADMVVEVAPDFGFTFFVDVLDTAVASAQNGNIRRYNARLLVNAVEVPIKRAELEANKDTLGMEVRVTLARPLVSLIPLSATLDFQIGIWTGSSYQYISMIAGGKLSSRSNAIKNTDNRPTDEVTITIIDIIADRWNRAPRAPIHLYDPNIVDAPTSSEIAEQRIQLEDGGYINPINIAIPGMRLRDVLIRAYINGTGFSEVICNIPNFPISEANFTLDGGYDGGVRPYLSLFSPLLFTDANNRLFIIDPDAPLPAGFDPRDFVQSVIHQVNDSLPQREPVNSILIRLKGLEEGGEVFTERFDQEHQEAGVFGMPSFTQTDISRRVREYRTVAEPLVIVREEVKEETISTVDWEFNPIEEIVTTQHFDVFNRKIGYTKTVARRLPDLDNDGIPDLLANVLRQEQSITYRVNPFNPNEDVQDRVTTVESGLVLIDDGNEYLDKPYRIPLTDAHISGYVDPTGDMRCESMDIRTTIEQLRVRGDQVDVEIRVYDHLSGTSTRSISSSRPGSATIDRRKQTANRTVLLTVDGTDSIGRRAQVFDAGELPGDVAMALAKRQLARLNDPPKEIEIHPAFVDLSVRRGIVLRPRTRLNAALGIYIVQGFSITINEFNPSTGIIAEMTITARELKS